MQLGLKGKTVIVTGGSSNIGRAITLAFAAEGSNIVIAARDTAQAKKVIDESVQLGKGGQSIFMRTDLTDFCEVQALMKATIEQFGRIDILVNNAGGNQAEKLFKDTTREDWDKIIALNYRAVLNCMKSVLPYMIERKSGNILNIGSEAGRIGEVREAVYSGCKSGVIVLSKAIAREVGRYNIRINTVCPGLIVPEPDNISENSLWQEAFNIFTPEVLDRVKKLYPLGRMGTAEDIANAVIFMASDAASFITGQTISVSGGYTMV